MQPDNHTEYMREYTRRNKDRINALRRKRYRLNPNYLKQSQLRLAKWRGGILREIAETKLKSGCIVCKYNRYAGALIFHHTDPSTKKFGISDSRNRPNRSIEEIRDEMKKCVIVCSNCHKELHAGIVSLEGLSRALPAG